MRLQVLFEVESLILVGERAVPSQLPRFEFRRMRGFSGIVVRQAQLQIRGCAGIFLSRRVPAANDVDIPHCTLRLWLRGCATRSLLGADIRTDG